MRIDKCKGSINVLSTPRTGCIKIGFERVGICDAKYERAIWNNTGEITIFDKIDLGQGVRIVNSGDLKIGRNFMIKADSSIICHNKITFGDDVLMSWDVLIMDTDHHAIYELGDSEHRINESREIVIGNHVWIGARVLILKGTVIGDGSMVSAGATISGVFKDRNCIIGSNHRIIRKDIVWQY